MPYLTSILGTVAFGFGAAAAYLHFHRRAAWAPGAVILSGLAALLVNAAYFGRTVHDAGVVETFRHSFDSTLLLAALLGLAGLLTHLSAALRGLDGFLFASAAVVEFWALLLVGRAAGAAVDYQPWFVTHSLAFMLSAAFFIAGGLSGIAYLLVNRLLRTKRPLTLVGTIASLESLERFSRWMLMVGFPLYTYGVLTGICELVRDKHFGPWAWLTDRLVVVSFITWGVYALLIGAMWLRPNMRGRRAARLTTWSMGLIAVVFLVVRFVSPIHR